MLSEADIDDKLRHVTWERKGPKTLTSPKLYKAHLRKVRENGWALDDEEDNTNIRCIAAPVVDMRGRVVAAISVVGTVLDIAPERLQSLAGRVRATAKEISHELGYRPNSEPAIAIA